MKKILLSFLLACLVLVACGDTSNEDSSETDISKYKFGVDISGRSIKITCPAEATDIKRKGTQLASGNEYTNEVFSLEDNGKYECGKKYLYLKAYVCDTCTEVSILMVAGILIADSLLTLGVSVLIYFGCKKKSARSSEIAPGGRTRGNKERPPPVPNPDYEPLQKRNQVLYDGLNKNYK